MAPTVANDAGQGYAPGSHWLNNTNGRVYICVGNAAGAAVWRETALITEAGIFFPATDDTVDLGTATKRFRSAYFSGGLSVGGNVTVQGNANVAGTVTAAGFTGPLAGNVTAISGTSIVNNLTVNGTADFTNTVLDNVASPVSGTDGATKSYVDAAVSALISSAPGTLDTLNELAAALGDDPAFATTVANDIGTKLPKAGGTMTGVITMGGNKVTGLPTPTVSSDAVPLQYVTTLYGSTSAAATSASQAAASKTAAATSETNAATSASNAAASASSSAASATASDSSRVAAATSETNADTSEAAALTHSQTAQGWATNANVVAVAGNILGTDTIGTVAASIADVEIVGDNIADVNNVAANSAILNAAAVSLDTLQAPLLQMATAFTNSQTRYIAAVAFS